MDFSQNMFTKEFLLSGNRYQIIVIDYQYQNGFEKVFKLNLQRSN